jgi:hypothetical protein
LRGVECAVATEGNRFGDSVAAVSSLLSTHLSITTVRHRKRSIPSRAATTVRRNDGRLNGERRRGDNGPPSGVAKP